MVRSVIRNALILIMCLSLASVPLCSTMAEGNDWDVQLFQWFLWTLNSGSDTAMQPINLSDIPSFPEDSSLYVNGQQPEDILIREWSLKTHIDISDWNWNAQECATRLSEDLFEMAGLTTSLPEGFSVPPVSFSRLMAMMPGGMLKLVPFSSLYVCEQSGDTQIFEICPFFIVDGNTMADGRIFLSLKVFQQNTSGDTDMTQWMVSDQGIVAQYLTDILGSGIDLSDQDINNILFWQDINSAAS